MSEASKRLAAFAALLAALLAGGIVAGGLLDPDARGADAPAHGGQNGHAEETDMATNDSEHGGHDAAGEPVHGARGGRRRAAARRHDARAATATAPSGWRSGSSTSTASPCATTTSRTRSGCT